LIFGGGFSCLALFCLVFGSVSAFPGLVCLFNPAISGARSKHNQLIIDLIFLLAFIFSAFWLGFLYLLSAFRRGWRHAVHNLSGEYTVKWCR